MSIYTLIDGTSSSLWWALCRFRNLRSGSYGIASGNHAQCGVNCQLTSPETGRYDLQAQLGIRHITHQYASDPCSSLGHLGSCS